MSNRSLELRPVSTRAFARELPAPESSGPSDFSAPAPVFFGPLEGGWTCEAFDRLEFIHPGLRRKFFLSSWKDAVYYQTLEETFADEFKQYYLLLRDERGQARVLQPCFLVDQDLTVSLAAGWRRLLRPLHSLLRRRVLMVGCIVGEGHIGAAALSEVPSTCGWLQQALTLFACHLGVALILFKDLPTAYRPALAGLTNTGVYTRLPGLPAVCLPLNFASFDDYVQNRLGKATRKSLRRKFREVDALAEPIRLEVKDQITRGESLVLHALYERVARRGDVHFEVFSPEYFRLLGERMPGRVRYFIWRQDERIIAFSFCTVCSDTIFDHDLGLDEEFAGPLHLYHVTFRDIVRWALGQGLRHYQSSPFNYHPKLHLRMRLIPQDLYAHHTSGMINRALRWFAPWAAPTRRESILGLFPNAADL